MVTVAPSALSLSIIPAPIVLPPLDWISDTQPLFHPQGQIAVVLRASREPMLPRSESPCGPLYPVRVMALAHCLLLMIKLHHDLEVRRHLATSPAERISATISWLRCLDTPATSGSAPAAATAAAAAAVQAQACRATIQRTQDL
ncbi:hypothetical protein N7539_009082 [Penicillium diatomitis]|uniref:Uncharacterized protein n=1 Tax=Penicillium diatomitis TaxID=2819901 RepID=A0A9X0BJH2_9EURO|nr:uncharacterized protein N7539_009082 [Penicillium diatomitis]KAJ5469464.1 hypothetical protein N7539_009082 [Penicillium diatomitis]